MSGHRPWSEIRRKRYNASTEPCDMESGPCACGGWHELRPGSNIEVPSFSRNGSAVRFPLATGKSKKLYLRALSRGFCDAAMRQEVRWGAALRACRANEGVADRAFYRLQRLEARA